jgi:hypothetical protein
MDELNDILRNGPALPDAMTLVLAMQPHCDIDIKQYYIVCLLGDKKEKRAVPVLLPLVSRYYVINRMIRESASMEAGLLHFFDDYPVANALAMIGEPAVEPCVHRLMTAQDLSRHEAKLLCWIIKAVCGPQLGEEKLRVMATEKQVPDKWLTTVLRVYAAVPHTVPRFR